MFLGLTHVKYRAQCLELSIKGATLESENQCELGPDPDYPGTISSPSALRAGWGLCFFNGEGGVSINQIQ